MPPRAISRGVVGGTGVYRLEWLAAGCFTGLARLKEVGASRKATIRDKQSRSLKYRLTIHVLKICTTEALYSCLCIFQETDHPCDPGTLLHPITPRATAPVLADQAVGQ